jgi:hypothetical protein
MTRDRFTMDRTHRSSREWILLWVTGDLVNRGPIYFLKDDTYNGPCDGQLGDRR